MKYHFSISGSYAPQPNTEITIITDSNYNDYLHALNTILYVVQSEIAKNQAILDEQQRMHDIECGIIADDDLHTDDGMPLCV